MKKTVVGHCVSANITKYNEWNINNKTKNIFKMNKRAPQRVAMYGY